MGKSKSSDKKYYSVLALVWDLSVNPWFKIKLTWVFLLKRLKKIEPLDPLVAFCVLGSIG